MINQTFPVLYGSAKFLVDPNKLFNASRKFAELVQPFGSDALHSQLVILPGPFTPRNIENFLKLCQDLPTDVQDSEMKEICEIAKMFKADKIYDTGLNFIRQSIDPTFFVPDSKYENGINHLRVEIPGTQNYIEAMDFDSEETNSSENQEEQSGGQKHEDIPTAIYEIRIDRPKLRLVRYHFIQDGKVLFSAKKKGNEIVIGEGQDVHMESTTANHCGHITQNSMNNQIYIDGQTIHLKYTRYPESDGISMDVTFNHQNQVLDWKGKEPKRNPVTGAYGLNLRGYYHHKAMASKRNSVLTNASGHSTFITRKMAENFYEAECHPDISKAIVFAIALSSIIGPRIEKAMT